MYLVRMRLDPRSRATRKVLSSAQAMHAAVLRACGSEANDLVAEGDRRILWRVDQHGRDDIELYLTSPGKPSPDGSALPDGLPPVGSWDIADYEPFLSQLGPGQRWLFRLTANPVRSMSRAAPDGRRVRGKPIPLTHAHQEEWLVARAERHGFTIPLNSLDSPEVSARELLQRDRHTTSFNRRSDGEDAGRTDRVQITRVTFEGVLDVTDPDALRLTLRNGMGKARAYGCGLMTLAPMR
ncbi:type I-E CRISPR-associated protein Cas6/Cse3/CasE [Luteipulveratus mongoliensis]|uniref:CRISPR-associated protein Cse3 n=1 Tax=Luteipulveratus mongoliensis TaxID=571913 RepID=A0A0K1JEW1_9MICO|nr:type I-E CRISPR-associated protein Cas6/Cse3/CasE [Luteipulveratus mongoliensis]AKU15133.1 hypothetical protein VV02_03400 [Luteipulveratus mongoliensis]